MVADFFETGRQCKILRHISVRESIAADAGQTGGQHQLQNRLIRPRCFVLIRSEIPHITGALDRQRIAVVVELPCEVVAAFPHIGFTGVLNRYSRRNGHYSSLRQQSAGE